MKDENTTKRMQDASKNLEEILKKIEPFVRPRGSTPVPDGVWRRGEDLPIDRGARTKVSSH